MRISWPRAISIQQAAALAVTGGVLLLPVCARAQTADPAPTLQPFQADPEPAATPVRRALPAKPAAPAGEPPVARAVPADSPARSARKEYPVPGADAPVESGLPRVTAPPASSPTPAPRRTNPPARRYPPPGGETPVEPVAPTAAADATPAPVQRRNPPRPTPPPARPTDNGGGATASETASPGSGDDSGDIRIAPGGPGAPATSPDEVQFNLANDFYVRKQYNQAAPEYERYLGLYPDGARRQAALWWLGECYRFLGRSTAARSSYQNLIIAYTDGEFVGPTHYRLASIYFTDKDYQSALPLFQRSVSLAKAADVRLSSLYYEALCLAALNRRDETKEIYDAILSVTENNPFRDESHLALAQMAVAQKHPNEAFKNYEALAREATRPALQSEASLQAALLARDLGQNDTASTLFQRAADLPASSANVRSAAQLGLMHLYYDANKYQRLLDLYASAVHGMADNSAAEAALLAANSQRQLGNHAEALGLYSQIIERFPKSPLASEARYQRVASLYGSGGADFLKAAEDYLLTNPPAAKGDQVKLMKADTLFRKNDYAGAALAYAILDVSSNLPQKYKAEASYRLGYCYAQARQPEKTVTAFTKFLRLYPDNPSVAKALVQRAVAYQQLKNYASALADFNAVINDHRNAKEREYAMQQRALILGQQDDSAGMAGAFRALLKEYPQTEGAGLANFYIGRAAFDAKDYAAALPAFDESRRLAPKDYGAKASMLMILCEYQIKDRPKLAAEIDDYLKAGAQPAVPAEVLDWLGEQEYEAKDYAGAERHLAAAAESPTNKTSDVWLLLARTRLNLQKWDGALEASQKFLAANSGEPGTRAVGLLTQGDAQLGLRKYDEAQKTSDEVLQLQPEGSLNAKARMLGGRVFSARGMYEQAGKSFMSVAVLYDDPEITPQALRLAAEAFGLAGKSADAAKASEELKTRFPNYTTAQTQ